MNRVWIWLLLKVDEWTCALLQAAFRREKLRWLKRELERQDVWKN
jgi:hypothetical protein